MKNGVIDIGDYIHPEERAATERIMALTQAAGWSESAMGEDLDETNLYILSSSCYHLPPEHPLARMAAEEAERFEAILAGVAHPRTRLVLRQYYALGMTDEEIAEADGFSARLAGSIRNGWLRQQGIEPRRRVRGGGGEGSR